MPNDDELQRSADDAGADLEAAFRGIDRLNAGDVPIAEADPADRDLPVRFAMEWPNGEITEVCSGFPRRDEQT